jgi:hypothetical protein
MASDSAAPASAQKDVATASGSAAGAADKIKKLADPHAAGIRDSERTR